MYIFLYFNYSILLLFPNLHEQCTQRSLAKLNNRLIHEPSSVITKPDGNNCLFLH